MKAPEVPIAAEVSVVPSGFSRYMVPAVTAVDVIFTLTRWLSVPLNVTRAF